MRIIIETDRGRQREVVATPDAEQARDIAQLLGASDFRELPGSSQVFMMDLIKGLRDAAQFDDLEPIGG